MLRPVRALPLLAGFMALAAQEAWYARSPKAATPESIPGMVRTTEIKVAPEVSGHLARVLVSRGQHVNRGDAVALLTNPELFAAVGQARAQVDLAAAARDRVYAGVREEQVESLRREVLKAQAAQTLAHQQLDRITALAVRSDASLQERDEAATRPRAPTPTSGSHRLASPRRSLGRPRRSVRWRTHNFTLPKPHETSSRRGLPRCCCARPPPGRSG